MGLSGTWKTRANSLYVPYDESSPNWGNGVNPVHSIEDSTGRNVAPDGASEYVAQSLAPDDWEASTADCATDVLPSDIELYGYGVQTGTADRQSWDPENAVEARGISARFPRWGPRRNGLPGGRLIRSMNHGASLLTAAKATPTEDVAQGWVNKDHRSSPEDAVTADDSQLYMQTSMTQRDKTRVGPQASGRANAARSPITSRIPGQVIKHFSGMERHYDMQPREQATRIRPFFTRLAATGNPDLMAPNAMYSSQPMIRVPSARPDQGQIVDPQYDSVSYDVTHGYVPEDMTW